jgi:hypothetical protein
MDKRTVFLSTAQARQTAHRYVDEAPSDWVMVLKPKTRSLDQNARLHAMLADISKQVDWYGRKLSPEAWKRVFSAALKKQDVVPGLNGDFGTEGIAWDGALRPIRDSDGDDETLVWAGKPERVPA